MRETATFCHREEVNYPATSWPAWKAQQSKQHPLTRSSPLPFGTLLFSLYERQLLRPTDHHAAVQHAFACYVLLNDSWQGATGKARTRLAVAVVFLGAFRCSSISLSRQSSGLCSTRLSIHLHPLRNYSNLT